MVLSRIFHLSDLHIRNGDNTYSRYEEYKEVFKETIISIKSNIESLNLSFNDFIIVITGDIFHNKNVIGNYGLIIYRKFIQALSSIGRIYIISGNHDYDQSDINKPSLVYSSTFAIPNVIVLNNSTSFVIDDIGISFVSIDKTLDVYRNSGRIQDLPKFPAISSSNVKYKLALFHGSFASAKLYNGKCVEETFNPYPLEWVSDFDYVLLGDIHKRQVFAYKNKTICGYAGSLIQQNFGEDIVNHGYLIWDLYNKDIKKINVYNDKGFVNIRENENKEILIRINGKYERHLEDYIDSNKELFPKNLDIKIFSNINIFNLNNILQKHNIKYYITEKIDNFNNFITHKGITHDTSISCDSINKIDTLDISCDNEIINNDALINYFKPLLSQENLSLLNKIIKNKELLLIDVNSYPEELREECLKINKEISTVINACVITDDTIIIPKSLYKIKYLEWEGLLCYENKNWLNMTDLDNKIFMVKGQNGTGKSAIYDILLLAIWGENTKKNSLTCGVVNHNKSKGYTIIDVEILDVNGDKGTKETYRIVRNYSRKNIGNKLQISNTVIYKYLNDEDMEILKKDTACNNELTRLFGNMEDFLATSMITQNVDYDILKMDFKSTLELIDKSFNIEYIYNLYNVFNKTINKYKGLHKYIESKKDVYEKLLLTSKYSDNHEKEIENMREDLELLNTKQCSLLEEYKYNSTILHNKNIDIDVNIEELLNRINLDNIVSQEIYDIKVKRLAELEFILKDKDIIKLSKSYDKSLIESQDINIIDKPCDISLIENENKYLKEYFDMYDNQDIDNQYLDDDGVEKLKQEYSDLDILIKSLITERPNKVNKIDKPNRAKKECLTNINNLFGNLEYLHKIIEDISNISNLNKSAKSNKHDSVSLCDLSLDNYKKYLQDKDNLEKNIENYNAKLRDNDEYLNKYFKEQENLKMLNVNVNVNVNVNIQQPYDSIDINQYVNAEEIMKDIRKIDYNYILRFLKANEESVEKYNEIKGRLKEAEEDKLKYVEELMLLETNEEYHYNPSCEYCCRRSWVNRIKELQIIIQRYEEDIDNIKKELDSNIDYDGLVEKMNRFKNNKNKYEILQERYTYLEYNEERERINKKINEALENKKEYSKTIDDNNKELENIKTYILIYYNKAIELREHLENIISYDKFKKWEDNYNEYVNKFQEIDNKIRKSVEILNYNKNIKPRIITHRALVEQYNKWEKYNINTNIIHSREYLDIKEIIENYRNNEVYKNYIEMKPIIKRTLELKNIIKEGGDNIQKYRDDITEKVAIFNYNKSNIKSLEDLRDILDNINNMLTTLDTIILNFQDFRINLYDKIILNKLLRNTNNMLKNICHSMTKPFELDYIINVSRDMIHINWLIKNVNLDVSKEDNNDCKTKQIISINQASGFQQFVISLALRLCLFGNNKAICKQLYIDEGFVSFDKYNLSIVPNFLRSLLAYFDTIIIVSHIDLIQETIEDNECIAEINYNSTTSVSSITYKKILDNSFTKVKKKNS